MSYMRRLWRPCALDFIYTCHDVRVATGKISQDNVTIGGSHMKAYVLVYKVNDVMPLFFKVPQKVLPPGVYNVTVMLKASSVISREVIAFEITKDPENAKILTKRIEGADFTQPCEWQAFNFNFTIKKPAFIAYVTSFADVYLYSVNILQVSGSV